MKKSIVSLLFMVLLSGVFAQEEGKVRGGLDLGFCIPKGGGGLCLDINLGYNIQDNMTVGIRLGSAIMGRTDPFGETASASGNLSIAGTYNYYFSTGTSPFAPFVGGGLGVYGVASMASGNNSVSVEAGNRLGGLLTAGAELGKFRFALEYNLIPSSAVKISGNETGIVLENDKIKNSYMAITIGFYIGGGKWKK